MGFETAAALSGGFGSGSFTSLGFSGCFAGINSAVEMSLSILFSSAITPPLSFRSLVPVNHQYQRLGFAKTGQN
jgi:hypothetical protein